VQDVVCQNTALRIVINHYTAVVNTEQHNHFRTHQRTVLQINTGGVLPHLLIVNHTVNVSPLTKFAGDLQPPGEVHYSTYYCGNYSYYRTSEVKWNGILQSRSSDRELLHCNINVYIVVTKSEQNCW